MTLVEVETISTSTTKLMVGLAGILMLSGAVSGYYYGDSGGSYDSTMDSFSVPEYDSHQEILLKLVVPFIFIFLIINFMLEKVLLFTYADDDSLPSYLRGEDEEKKRVKKYSTLISLTIAAMLIPTPFWDKIIFVSASIPVLALGAIVLVLLYFLYLIVKFMS